MRPNTRRFNKKAYSKVRVLPNLNLNQNKILEQRVQKLRANGINIRTVGWANGDVGVYARRATTRKPPPIYNRVERKRRKGAPLKKQSESIRKLARTKNMNQGILDERDSRELTDVELFMAENAEYLQIMDFDEVFEDDDLFAEWETFMAGLNENTELEMAIQRNTTEDTYGIGTPNEEVIRWALGEDMIQTGLNPRRGINDSKNMELLMSEEEFQNLDFTAPDTPNVVIGGKGIVSAELPGNVPGVFSIPEYVALPVVTVRSSNTPWSDKPENWAMKAAFRLDDTLLSAQKELDKVFESGKADYSQTQYPGEVAFLNAIAAKSPKALDVAKRGAGRQRLNANDEDIEEEAELLSLYRDNEIVVVGIDTAVFSGRRGDFEGIRLTPNTDLEFDGDDGYYIDGEWVERDEVESDEGYLDKYGIDFADNMTDEISRSRGWGDRRGWKDGLSQLWFRGVKFREKEPGEFDDQNFANQFGLAVAEWGESNVAEWVEIYGGSPHILTESELLDWNRNYHAIWDDMMDSENNIPISEAGRKYRMDGSLETPSEAKKRFENILDNDGDRLGEIFDGDMPSPTSSSEIELKKWEWRG